MKQNMTNSIMAKAYMAEDQYDNSAYKYCNILINKSNI